MKIRHDPPSPEANETWDALRRAVANNLEKKRRLGHYFAVWRDGHPDLIGDDIPDDDTRHGRDE